jgi:predicted nucleotidyltransferase
VRELCAERDISLEKIQFFGSCIKNIKSDDSDVDMALVSSVFEGKDIFQRAEMTKGLHRALVKRFSLPFDIVFYSINERLDGNSPLLREIQQGKGEG